MIVFKNQGIPRDNSIFIVFAPKALDIPMPPSPFLDIIANDIDSGRQPPAARKVKPRTASGMPKTCPRKKKSNVLALQKENYTLKFWFHRYYFSKQF